MIRYLKHTDIDKIKWDACVTNSPNGLIYAYSWYLDIVCKEWEALVENDYTSIMPLPKGKKYGFTYTYPPPFTQQLGLFSIHAIAEKDVLDFLSHIPSEYKYVEMNLNEQNPINTDSYKSKKGITHLLNLNNTYKNIIGNYSTQTKRNLKKAQSSLLTVDKNTLPKKTIEMFCANRGKEFKQEAYHYVMLERLMLSCIKKGMGQSWGVNTHENELCAGAFFLQNNGRVIFLFSGVNEKGYDTQAMTFLINSYIEEHAESNLTFDFEGSLNADLARFYSGFGSDKTEYTQIRKSTLPAPLKWLKEIQYKKKS